MALVHLCVNQPENITRTNQPAQCFGLGHVLPSLDSPCLSVSCPCAALWCLSMFVPEAQCKRDFSLLLPSSCSLSNVPVYRWDVDAVDKRILHSLGFFWSWFVTVTVTVWKKNKIRIRHASLGELRQKKSELDNNQTWHASCFHWDTNQVKSSHRLCNKKRQITAWPAVLGGTYYLFF